MIPSCFKAMNCVPGCLGNLSDVLTDILGANGGLLHVAGYFPSGCGLFFDR